MRNNATNFLDKRTKGFHEGKFLSNKLKSFLSLQDHENRPFPTIEDMANFTMLVFEPILKSVVKKSKKDYKSYTNGDWQTLKNFMGKIIRISACNAYCVCN